MLHTARSSALQADASGLDFLWLELTNQCNLQCVHCYAESGPRTGNRDTLEKQDYISLLDEAYDLGCRRVQFIGGEPTLNHDLESLIVHAAEKGFDLIEVFTNLTRLTEPLAVLFKTRRVHVATSVYANVAGIHDRITTVPGSFARTVANLKKLVAAGVPVRAGLIQMEENQHIVDETLAFLRGLGVWNAGFDGLRKIGRGACSAESDMSELCGQCAGAKLCVGPDGLVSPCIMSKAWSVGSLSETTLSEIVCSEKLSMTRSAIYHAVQSKTNENIGECNPQYCGPGSTCPPATGPGPCGPSGCHICHPG
jgi:sulfatase maturation enzyme AslB (radical SAM superfamily)